MPRKLSRRYFLRSSALATAGTAMANGAAVILGQATAAAGGPEAVAIILTVNGIAHKLEIEPRMTLAEALRGPLGLTGTKIAIRGTLRTHGGGVRAFDCPHQAPRTLSRDNIMGLLKGQDWSSLDRTIDGLVARLRRKIELASERPRLIKTVRGVGYAFGVEVKRS